METPGKSVSRIRLYKMKYWANNLKNTSLSTSGNSPNYTNHIVRPGSGQKNNERKLVCVVSGNPVDAEVLSTTLMVATEQEQERILQNFEIESFKIYNT